MPHKDVLVNERPHIWWESHKIIMELQNSYCPVTSKPYILVKHIHVCGNAGINKPTALTAVWKCSAHNYSARLYHWGLHSLMFAQTWNCPMIHFSECTLVVKWHTSVQSRINNVDEKFRWLWCILKIRKTTVAILTTYLLTLS